MTTTTKSISKRKPRSIRHNGPGGGTAVALNMSDLAGSLGYALRRAQLLAFQEFGRVMVKYDISTAQFAILVLIDANPGLKQTAISDFLGIQKANMVGLLDILEERKLAERRKDELDRRAYCLFLTPEGKTLVRKLRKDHDRYEHQLASRMEPGKRDELLNLLRAFFLSPE